MNGLQISYNLGGFGEVNYINVTPHDAAEQGHYFTQLMADGSVQWIGGFGKTPDRNASYMGLVQGATGAQDWKGGAYFWLSGEYGWIGTAGPKPMVLGTEDRDWLWVMPSGGIFLGEENPSAGIGEYEIGMEKAQTTGAPGKGHGKIAFIDDPDNPDKMMLVAYFGETPEPVVIGREP